MGENDTVASILINDRVDNYRNRLPAGFTRIQYIVILLNERCTGIELYASRMLNYETCTVAV